MENEIVESISLSNERLAKFKEFVKDCDIHVCYNAQEKESTVDVLMLAYYQKRGWGNEDFREIISIPKSKNEKSFNKTLNKAMIDVVKNHYKALKLLDMDNKSLEPFKELLNELNLTSKLEYLTKTKGVITVRDENDKIILVKGVEISRPLYHFYLNLNDFLCTELKNRCEYDKKVLVRESENEEAFF